MAEQKKTTKLFTLDVTSIDEAKRHVTFCFSDNQQDRDGEIVDQKSWIVENYLKNPVIFWKHRADEPEDVLGQAVDMQLNVDGKSYVTVQFDDKDTNPKADTVFKQVVKRTLRCVSAGFLTGVEQIIDGVKHLIDNELLEISIVPIPSNTRAVVRAFKDGSLSRKDAQWMLESMRKEADLLEEQLKQQDEQDAQGEQQNMDDIKTQISALTAAVAKTAETVNTLVRASAEPAETATTKQADGGNAAKGAVAQELIEDAEQEEKWQKMSPVYDIFYAFTDVFYDEDTSAEDFSTLLTETIALLGAVADGTYAPTGAAADTEKDVDGKAFAAGYFRKSLTAGAAETTTHTEAEQTDASAPTAATDPVAQTTGATDTSKTQPTDTAPDEQAHTENTDDSAKGGDNDQPGAETEEFDENAELTPQIQAQIDSALQAADTPR